MTLTASDISLLREFPASTDPPRGLTTEQRRRVEDLPWGLLRDGRRTDLGDDVVEMADRIAALEVEHAAALSAPVEGVNLEEVLRLDREATPGPWVASSDQEPTRVVAGVDAAPSYQQPGQTWIAGHEAGGRSIRLSEANAELIAYYRTAAPTLAREVQRLRLEVADLRTHHTEALTAAGAPLTDDDGKALSDPQRVAYLSDLVDDGKARHLFQRLVERTAAALGLDKERLDPETGEPYLPSWHDIPEQVEQLVKRSAARETP